MGSNESLPDYSTNSLLVSNESRPNKKKQLMSLIQKTVGSLVKNYQAVGILFIGDFLPNKYDVFVSLNNFIKIAQESNTNFLKIICCLCDEEIEEFTYLKEELIRNYPDFYVLDYDLPLKEALLDYYNIFDLPCLIFLDKFKNILKVLNSTEILELGPDTLTGLKNTLYYNERLQARGFNFGDLGMISLHPHEMIYTDYTSKTTGYATGNYICDICSKSFNRLVPNFYCGKCGYDCCDDCFIKHRIDE